MATELRGYAKTISEATGVTNATDLADIEDSMRHDIFHSTLDWQTRSQLMRGAREAWNLVQIMRDPAALAAALA
ncbi:MAG: hypothetical protein H0W39_07600 [Sphingomonas sp.]|nr:hypothetical protein [Sphingomonas sp.]